MIININSKISADMQQDVNFCIWLNYYYLLLTNSIVMHSVQ